MQFAFLIIILSLNNILVGMRLEESKDPLVSKDLLSTSTQVSSLSSKNPLPISKIASDDELNILAQKIAQQTLTLKEHITILRKHYANANHKLLVNELQLCSIHRLAEIVQETGKCTDIEHKVITEAAFAALVGFYHRYRFDIEAEFKGIAESIKLHLIKCILKRSSYTNPDTIKYDNFTLPQAYAALAIYNTIYDRKKVCLTNPIFHRSHAIMLQAQLYNQSEGFSCIIS